MHLTLSTTYRPATDLGFLLHKHHDRVQEFRLSFGTARVFYPEASERRCTAALMLEVDPVRLARSRGAKAPDVSLAQYVNDRSYAASSLLGVVRLADALNQLHVLLPVLDESKHYWQGPDEVDKLMRSGQGWRAAHPDAKLITRRYLGRRGGLTRAGGSDG